MQRARIEKERCNFRKKYLLSKIGRATINYQRGMEPLKENTMNENNDLIALSNDLSSAKAKLPRLTNSDRVAMPLTGFHARNIPPHFAIPTHRPDGRIHVFEAAGLGEGPFNFTEFRDLGACMGECGYCGKRHIRYEFHISAASGERFVVGSECITHSGDAGLIYVAALVGRLAAARVNANNKRHEEETVIPSWRQHLTRPATALAVAKMEIEERDLECGPGKPGTKALAAKYRPGDSFINYLWDALVSGRRHRAMYAIRRAQAALRAQGFEFPDARTLTGTR